jgi:hypothetical protein
MKTLTKESVEVFRVLKAISPGKIRSYFIQLYNKIVPTEVKCEFLKSSFFVAAVFLWPNRVVI